MTADEVKQEIIRRGIKSIQEAYDKDSPKFKGGIIGFELCENLHTMEDFEKVIRARQNREMSMAKRLLKEEGSEKLESYWEHRYATLQVAFVYERLLVLWGAPSVSAKAAIQVAEIIEDLTNG